ncbi:hypothetical protein AEA42_14915 [Shewanella sp. Sh95]|nr:hypothetical protein AEA42_14915 [Shewanella sp. Sh95]
MNTTSDTVAHIGPVILLAFDSKSLPPIQLTNTFSLIMFIPKPTFKFINSKSKHAMLAVVRQTCSV